MKIITSILVVPQIVFIDPVYVQVVYILAVLFYIFWVVWKEVSRKIRQNCGGGVVVALRDVAPPARVRPSLVTLLRIRRELFVKQHDVILDTAGWHNYSRLTCNTCEGKTLLRKPYMVSWEWRLKVIEFIKEHPSKVGDSYRDGLG